jgi:hypothetical protein
MSGQEEKLLEKLDIDYAWSFTQKLVELSDHKVAGTGRDYEAAICIEEEMVRLGLSHVNMDTFPVLSRDISRGGQVVIKDGPVIKGWPMIGSWGTSDEGISGELLYVGEGTLDDYSEAVDATDKIVLYKRRWPDMIGEDGIFRSTPILEAWSRKARAMICFDELGPKDSVRIQILLIGEDNYRLKIPTLAISHQGACELIEIMKMGTVEATLRSSIDNPALGESFNVLGYIAGSKFPDELVVISSHYDTYWKGAADSLSGIGAILGIAKGYLDSGVRPERTLVFLAHGAEEGGQASYFDWLVGSTMNLDKNHPDWIGRTVAQLNFDVIAYSPDDCFLECSPELSPLVNEVFERHGKRGAVLKQNLLYNLITYVDSAAYIVRGIPSANIMYWPEDYWRFYHTNYDDMAIVTQASLQYAMELWSSASLKAASGDFLSLSLEQALEQLNEALIHTHCKLSAIGIRLDSLVPLMDSIGRTITQIRILKATVLLSEEKKSLELRQLELDAIARLNKEQYIAGGSFGFHLFYCFYPYAMDAIHIKQAIDQLKRHDREKAKMNLEMVYAMRAAGRHMSKSAYELYIKHLWAKPGGWAIKMQKYIDVWDQWYALRSGEKDDELSALPDLFKKAIALLTHEVENLKPIVDKIQGDFSRLSEK